MFGSCFMSCRSREFGPPANEGVRMGQDEIPGLRPWRLFESLMMGRGSAAWCCYLRVLEHRRTKS